MQESNEALPFSALLRQQRLAAGLTQAALAERAGLSDRTVQDLERGISRPRGDTIRRLRDGLTLSPEILMQFEAALSAPRPNSGRVHRRPGPGARGGSLHIVATPPPPAPLPIHRQNRLPAPLTSFVGREREVEEAGRILQSTRLLTLYGAGGVGKTRLAIEIADTYGRRYADGVVLVELDALFDPTLVPRAVASALGAREHPGEPLVEAVVRAIETQALLLVLDNCEHLAEACGELTARLF